MTNLEKAKAKFVGYLAARDEMNLAIEDKKVFELLELAATPDWKYPNKNEFPPQHKQHILAVTIISKPDCLEIIYNKEENYFYIEDNYQYETKYEISEIIAWCELPNFRIFPNDFNINN